MPEPPSVAEAVSEHLGSPAWFCQKWIRKRSCKLLSQQNREANHLRHMSGGLPGVGDRGGKNLPLAGPLVMPAQECKDAKNIKVAKHPGKG